MANHWLDRLNALLGRKKDPAPIEPVPAPTPEPPKAPGTFDYLKAWQLLKKIPLQKLGSVVSLSAVIVFFALSGVIAWLVVLAKFALTLSR
jgi:hypothetical protein